jgi:hypothetical protein
MYRRTSKYANRREWRPRTAVPEVDRRPVAWRPPKLRRRITIEDFDGAEPRIHVVELYRTARIDSYRAVIDGREWHARIGWSRVLDGLRRALPRLTSPRHFGG